MYKRQPKPTFNGIVMIGVAGDEPGLIDFEFKFQKRKDYEALIDQHRAGKISEEVFLSHLISGWNHQHKDSLVDEPYSAEALNDLLDTYWAGADIHNGYLRAIAESKRKN